MNGSQNKIKEVTITSDYTVIGGGVPGVCTAITAAREGLKVALVQDRPVLGGNASSEMRVWMLGATAAMDNNNRWSREGGVVDEILTENIFRNAEGNAYLIDALLLDKVLDEENIQLFLNTSVNSAETDANNKILSVSGYNSNNETSYIFKSKFFSDSSGDGVVGYISGADHTITAEKKEEFNESFVRDQAYGHCLGNSLMFLVKDTDEEVKYTAPNFALRDITKLPKHKEVELLKEGCHFWWFEYGGRKDTIRDAEEIKFELNKVVYGAWDHIKNSGKFPEAKNKTLEWVGSLPGKREARRFYGDYMLTQNDVLQQKNHKDNIAHGGWSIDLHPADGMYSTLPSCNQWHAKGVYAIPYRCLYSRNIKNLFLGGRLISSSHIAFGTTRVMLTGAVNGQATAMATAMCIKYNLEPKDLLADKYLSELQQRLIAKGQYIPNVLPMSENNLVSQAKISSNDTLSFTGFKKTENYKPLEYAYSLLLPVKKGKIPSFKLNVKAFNKDTLKIKIRTTESIDNFTPYKIIENFELNLEQGIQDVIIEPQASVNENCYIYITLDENPNVLFSITNELLTAVSTLYRPVIQEFNKEVDKVESFERWHAIRHHEEFNIAIEFLEEQKIFEPENILKGHYRPLIETNAWVGKTKQDSQLKLKWDKDISLKNGILTLFLDTNTNHSVETAGKNHRFHTSKYCIKDYTITNENNEVIVSVKDNHQAVNHHNLGTIKFNELTITVNDTWGNKPAIFGICLK